MFEIFTTLIKNFYCLMMDIDVNQYDKILNYQKRYKEIQSINDCSMKDNNIIKHIIINYLYGDFIILTFEDTDENIVVFDDINYIKSKLLRRLFKKKKRNKRNKFKIHLTYEEKYINIILKYLIYFENDDIELIYNNSLISFIFKDNFLNKLIFSLNCEELIHLQTFTDYFGINSLNEKINIVLDLIRTSMDDNGSLINMREPLSLYL
tara:strand:+ start:84 stop:707 length:624 start_codon:yes stop_codon:yes gene_type:complete